MEKKKKNLFMKQMPFKKVDMSVFTFICLIITVMIFISSIIMIIVSDQDANRSRMIFNCIESLIMFFLIALPTLTNRIIRYKIPPLMEILYMVFCAGSIICGEIFDFYGKVGWWDSMLHSASGVLFGVLGYVIINTFNSHDGKRFKFSPLFVSIWVVCFTLAMGAFWEICEWCADEWFGTNAQQYCASSGTLAKDYLVGHDALNDTMKDLMLDLLGAIVAAVIGFVEMHKDRNGISSIVLEKENRVEHITNIPFISKKNDDEKLNESVSLNNNENKAL